VALKSETQIESANKLAHSIRAATVGDAAAIWQLVQDSESLDSNSCYAYLLLCSDFSDTCLVACDGERLMGFVAAYVPPNRQDVLFVWQIGVDAKYRGQGLAQQLLAKLVDDAAPSHTRYLEATITPGNLASQRLFGSLAGARGWQFAEAEHFEAGHFAGPEHDEEVLIRIGPMKEQICR
jgi:L-2,4-diaminobutyric acid acetyltransferase